MQIVSDGVAQTIVYDAFGRVVAEYGGQSAGAGGTQYVMQDHQGSTRVVTSHNGGVAARHDYQPFGEEISAGVGQRTGDQRYSFADSTRMRYAELERDSASGLDHAEWRKYDSSAGRWTSADP